MLMLHIVGGRELRTRLLSSCTGRGNLSGDKGQVRNMGWEWVGSGSVFDMMLPGNTSYT